jgi:hypothetical protein
MINEAENTSTDTEKKALLEALGGQLSKSKTELVTDIGSRLTDLLGMDVRQAFDSVATAQQIRGGSMNLDRAHKSMLVLLAHVLTQRKDKDLTDS